MPMIPLYDRILVRRDAESENQLEKLGLVVADNAKEKAQTGTVVSVGTGRIADDGTIRPLAVKQGDTVLFGKYAGTEIKIDGETLLIMREEEVVGILKPKETTSE